MDNQEFVAVLENIKDLTFVQIVRLLRALKYKTIVALVLFLCSIAGASFVAGKYSQQKDTAVMLEKPFSMRIEYNNKYHDYNKLVLIKDPTAISPKDNQVVLSLREIHNAFDVSQVGKVIATLEENKLSGIWQIILSSATLNKAYAHSKIFNWNGHENDYNFKENFVAQHTVNRYYGDGCILSYQVDYHRRSMPHTFKWLHSVH